jgi:arylsulfatase A-like enzyme
VVLLLLPLALLSALLLGSCGETTPDRPSALLITLDTTRADALSCYGATPGLTPNLDRLAADGILFECAHTVAPVTMPAHASMLSGLFPIRHSVRANDGFALPHAAETLAEIARGREIQTGAVVAAAVLHERFGLKQGFDFYDRPPSEKTSEFQTYGQFDAKQVIDRMIARFDERDPTRPFFFWAHLFDPHGPYSPPEPFRTGIYAGRPYLGEVGYVDQQVGRLIDHLREAGVLDETTILVVGDHGEALGEHGEGTHGVLCYEGTLRVPMLLRHPDRRRAGERSRETVSVVDVFPTLLEALGLPERNGIDGRSLLHPVPEERGIYFESYEGYLAYGYAPLAGWLDAHGKYLHGPEPLFFDLRADPREETDLAGEREERIEQCRIRISEVASRPKLPSAASRMTDPDSLAHLRHLGYAAIGDAGVEFPHPLAPSDLPGAESVIALHEQLLAGTNLLMRREPARAEEILAEISELLPRSPAAHLYLAQSRIEQDRLAAAIEPLQRLLAERPDLGGAHFDLGICLQKAGRSEEAIVAFKRAIRLEPDHRDYYPRLVFLLRQAGRGDEAAPLEQHLRYLDTGR